MTQQFPPHYMPKKNEKYLSTQKLVHKMVHLVLVTQPKLEKPKRPSTNE